MNATQSLKFVNDFLNTKIFNPAYVWTYNYIQNTILKQTEGQQSEGQQTGQMFSYQGMMSFVLSLIFNPLRILVLGFCLVVIILINIVYFIISRWHLWVMLIYLFVFCLIIWVAFYLWGQFRWVINDNVIPGLNKVTEVGANAYNDAIYPINKFFDAGIREIPRESIQGEVPTLFSVLKLIWDPLLEKILTPLRADYYD